MQMYDWPEVQPRLDHFWQCVSEVLSAKGIAAPASLSRPSEIASGWRDPDLLIGQTCGLPLVSGRCGGALQVAQPDFGINGARNGEYSSAIICRADDPSEDLEAFRNRTAAINEYGSQSGCNALADAILDVGKGPGTPFLSQVIVSGAHRASADLVAAGQADIAAIDAVAWALHGECERHAHAKLRVLQWTRPMPALPFICAPRFADLRADLCNALQEAVSDRTGWPIPVPRGGVKRITPSDYDPIRAMADRTRGTVLAPGAPAIGI